MTRPRDPRKQVAKSNRYAGAECSKGHTVRYVKSGACVACQAEMQRARRAKRKGK